VPLPVRGARPERRTPAEARPGIRPDERPLVEEHAAAPPVPRNGAVRGTMGKPHLPRRRAQEHLVPQLRERPAPRPDAEEHIGHDPGLLAAFQRGIGLAEAQQSLEAAHTGTDLTTRHPPLPYRDTAQDVVAAAPEPRTTPHRADGTDHIARYDGSAPAG
jgi:hypothetical protein